MTVKPLRPYQITSINLIFEALRMGQKPVLSLPCGGGKTRIASEIFAMGRKHGKRVGFCVPYISLIGQTYRAFLDAGLSEEEISVIQADHPMTDYRKEIQIMSVETLNRRKLLPDLDLVIFDECFHPDHELYTRDGWKPIECVKEGEKVLAFDAETDRCAMEIVQRTISKEFSGNLVRLRGKHFHTLTTPLHEQPHVGLSGKGRKAGRCEERKRLAVDSIPPTGYVRLPVAAFTKPGEGLSWADALHIAFQADGHKLYYGKRDGLFTYRFAFRRERKIGRLETILCECGIEYKKTENCRGDCVISFKIKDDLSKSFDWYDVLESCERNDDFLKELIEWDGWSNSEGCFWEATNERDAERVQMIAETCGYSASVNKLRGKDRWRVRWLEKGVWRSGFSKSYEPYSGKVHCVTVESGNVVTRYMGVVSISGNCHRQSKLYARWMQEAPATKWLGVSATPWAKGMGDIWDRMLIPTSTRELIDQGYLVPFNYFAPSSPDLSGVKIRAGDYAEDQLAKAMNKTTLVADIVKTWLEKAERRPTFLFAVDCAHAKHIQQQFLDAGVRAEYVDAYTPVEDREKILEKLSTGEIEIVCNIATMTTGVDCPNVSCVVLARPTKSEMLFLQMCGRGLRIASGKQNCIFLDHSDTGLNLGLPDEIVYEDFRRGQAEERDKQERKEPLPKKCGACGYLKPAKVHQCPACGFVPEAKPNVLHCDGELEELGAGGKRHKSKATRDEKQEFWSELLYLANERGYKRGWASNKYREKFDVWPQGLHDQMAYPKASTRSWLKSRQIAWAKAREKMEKAG